jgi:hypothetical protein
VKLARAFEVFEEIVAAGLEACASVVGIDTWLFVRAEGWQDDKKEESG